MDDLLWSAKHPAKERGAYDVPVEVICRQSLSDEFRTGEKNKIKANAFKANCSAVDRMFPIMVSLLLSRQEKNHIPERASKLVTPGSKCCGVRDKGPEVRYRRWNTSAGFLPSLVK
jgi:hypothetical protein